MFLRSKIRRTGGRCDRSPPALGLDEARQWTYTRAANELALSAVDVYAVVKEHLFQLNLQVAILRDAEELVT